MNSRPWGYESTPDATEFHHRPHNPTKLERIAPNGIAYAPHVLYILHEVWQKSGKENAPRPEGFLHEFTRCPISSRFNIISERETKTGLLPTDFKTGSLFDLLVVRITRRFSRQSRLGKAWFEYINTSSFAHLVRRWGCRNVVKFGSPHWTIFATFCSYQA